MSRTIQLPAEPVIIPEGESPNFFRGQTAPPVHHRWQRWHDEWRKTDRDLRWHGNCIGCGRNVYAFDDGENDPRGVLGDNALWTVTSDLDEEVELIACAICANDYDAYKNVLAIGKHQVRGDAVVRSPWKEND